MIMSVNMQHSKQVANKMNHISSYLGGQRFRYKIEWTIFVGNQAVVSFSIETLNSGIFKLKGTQLNQNKKREHRQPKELHSLLSPLLHSSFLLRRHLTLVIFLSWVLASCLAYIVKKRKC